MYSPVYCHSRYVRGRTSTPTCSVRAVHRASRIPALKATHQCQSALCVYDPQVTNFLRSRCQIVVNFPLRIVKFPHAIQVAMVLVCRCSREVAKVTMLCYPAAIFATRATQSADHRRHDAKRTSKSATKVYAPQLPTQKARNPASRQQGFIP